MASKSIGKNIVPQQYIIKRPLGRPRNPNKKVYIKKGTPRTGRPQIYTPELGDYILEQIMEGRGLNEICKEANVPVYSTICGWLRETSTTFQKDFSKSYCIAREVQGHYYADEVKTIADDIDRKAIIIETLKDEKGRITGIRKLERDTVAERRLQVKTRMWLASKLAPKKFSNKLQLTGDEDKPLIPTNTKIVVNFV